MRTIRLLLLPLGLAALTACATQEPAQRSASDAVAADNTARNADSPTALTPVDQAENEADLQISANIRKAILADSALSANAHNVKIITSGGVVTLRGPINNQQEKASIEAKAKLAEGVTKVDSFLEVR